MVALAGPQNVRAETPPIVGSYTVRLTVGARTLTQPITISPDRRDAPVRGGPGVHDAVVVRLAARAPHAATENPTLQVVCQRARLKPKRHI